MTSHDWLPSLLWTAMTVGCYVLGLGVRRLARYNAIANPVLISITAVSILLFLTGTSYSDYFRATRILTFLLAPATVALGVPLARSFGGVRNSMTGVVLGLLAGSLVSMLSGVLLVLLLGGSKTVAMSMLPKAVTTPIAISIAAQIGGQPALTASLAIVGGIIAAITLRAVLGKMKITDSHAVGLAAGTAGSGIAAAHVVEMGDGAAAFAAIGIGMNGFLTALLAPMLAACFR